MRNKRNKINKISFKFNIKNSKVLLWGILCLILTVGCIFMTIETSTSGAEMAALQTKEQQLLARQRDLQEQLVQSLSVQKLQEQSSTLGFARVQNLVYVTDSAPVAAKLP